MPLAASFVGAVVLALKYAAYRITGSIALYSDALESIINMVTAVAAFMAVRLSAEPADKNHPYGHHKVEYFSAVLEGVLIIVAALAILREAYVGFLGPQSARRARDWALPSTAWRRDQCGLGLASDPRGPAHALAGIVADGRHLLTDVFTSVGVDRRPAARPAHRLGLARFALAAFVALNISGRAGG